MYSNDADGSVSSSHLHIRSVHVLVVHSNCRATSFFSSLSCHVMSIYSQMYTDVVQVLLRRIQITNNKALDGVLDFLNSKNMTSDGPLDLIDDPDSDDDNLKQSYKQLGHKLPGTQANFGRPIARTKALQLCATGRTFAAATTEGLLIYSMDDNLIFDPADIAIDVTPEVCSLHYLHFA